MNKYYTHGKIECDECFIGDSCCSNGWNLANNPSYWGSVEPKVLVLGFSKGATQMNEENFEAIAFKGMRQRLKEILILLKFLDEDEDIDSLFNKDEKKFGFASLIRCGISKDGKTSGTLIQKSFRNVETKTVIENCTTKFLLNNMPKSVKNVVLLGSAKGYKKSVMKQLEKLFTDFKYKDENSFFANGIYWQFSAHPSPANGWFNRWKKNYIASVMN